MAALSPGMVLMFKEPVRIKRWDDFNALKAKNHDSFVVSYSIKDGGFNRISYVEIIGNGEGTGLNPRNYKWAIDIDPSTVHFALDDCEVSREVFFDKLKNSYPEYFEWLLWRPEWLEPTQNE